MQFLINELSFIGQAINKYEADELMKNILDIIQEISVLQNGDPIQTHSSFASQKLSANGAEGLCGGVRHSTSPALRAKGCGWCRRRSG